MVGFHSITWITEAGLYDYWMNSLSSNSTVCERPPTKITVRTPLSLGNVWVSAGQGGHGRVYGKLVSKCVSKIHLALISWIIFLTAFFSEWYLQWAFVLTI